MSSEPVLLESFDSVLSGAIGHEAALQQAIVEVALCMLLDQPIALSETAIADSPVGMEIAWLVLSTRPSKQAHSAVFTLRPRPGGDFRSALLGVLDRTSGGSFVSSNWSQSDGVEMLRQKLSGGGDITDRVVEEALLLGWEPPAVDEAETAERRAMKVATLAGIPRGRSAKPPTLELASAIEHLESMSPADIEPWVEGDPTQFTKQVALLRQGGILGNSRSPLFQRDNYRRATDAVGEFNVAALVEYVSTAYNRVVADSLGTGLFSCTAIGGDMTSARSAGERLYETWSGSGIASEPVESREGLLDPSELGLLEAYAPDHLFRTVWSVRSTDEWKRAITGMRSAKNNPDLLNERVDQWAAVLHEGIGKNTVHVAQRDGLAEVAVRVARRATLASTICVAAGIGGPLALLAAPAVAVTAASQGWVAHKKAIDEATLLWGPVVKTLHEVTRPGLGESIDE